MSIVNKPKVSKAIASFYEAMVVLILALLGFFVGLTMFTPLEFIGVATSVLLAFVACVLILILASFLRTSYVLTDEELVINATKLIGGRKTVPLRTINSVEKTIIPFGIRLFGASFYGGYFYIPSLGRAFLAITNFEDGLLVKTEHGSYVITPSDPLSFKELIQSRIKTLQPVEKFRS
jgi:hypothetical protein